MKKCVLRTVVLQRRGRSIEPIKDSKDLEDEQAVNGELPVGCTVEEGRARGDTWRKEMKYIGKI